jgi:hypothetical protein
VVYPPNLAPIKADEAAFFIIYFVTTPTTLKVLSRALPYDILQINNYK